MNILDKRSFLSGKREKWFAVLLAYVLVILFVDLKTEIQVAPYLEFLTITSSLFILGGNVDSFMKIRAATPVKEKE
jgi:hypothetical protein